MHLPGDWEITDGASRRMQDALGASSAALVLEDDTGCIALWTQGATDLLGWNPDEALGRTFPLSAPPWQSSLETAREEARRGRPRTLSDVAFPCLGGGLRQVILHAAPARLADAPTGVLWTLERQPIPSFHPVDLAEHSQLSEQLLEAIPIPVFAKDVHGRYIVFNSAWEQFFGRQREDWIGKTVNEMFPEEAARQYADQDARLMREGGMLEWEGLLPNRHAELVPCIYRKIALKDSSGCVWGIVGSILDVANLRLAESRFRQVVELTPGALLVVDPDGCIVLANAHAEKLFGYDRAELIGSPVDSLLPERYRHVHQQNRKGFFANPGTRPMGLGRDLYALRRDGTELPVEVALGQLPSERGGMVIAVLADITARKAAQEQIEASLREKTILLDEIHHRVKNNLQVIGSLLNLQASASQEERARSALQDAMGRVRSIGLMHQLLYERSDFSTLDLAAYLERLIRLVRSAGNLEARHIAVHLDLQSVVVAIGQAMYCGLIVNELVTNALKHAFPDSRQGTIRVSLSRSDESTVMLVLADDGVGFPDVAGSGTLGLRLVKLLTDQVGGTLHVEHRSREGASVRFELSFPCKGRGQSHDQRRYSDS